jgi:hypothetical protein
VAPASAAAVLSVPTKASELRLFNASQNDCRNSFRRDQTPAVIPHKLVPARTRVTRRRKPKLIRKSVGRKLVRVRYPPLTIRPGAQTLHGNQKNTMAKKSKEKGQSLRRDDALPDRAWFCIRGPNRRVFAPSNVWLGMEDSNQHMSF